MTIDWSTRKNYGTLGKVGIATPAGGDIAIADFHRHLHPDILISDIPIPMQSLTPERLKQMSEDAVRAMEVFRDYNPIDLAFLSCTSGSLIGGKGYDAYLCKILKEKSGAREAYTTTTAVLAALRAIGSKRISIVTPYPDDVNERERDYFIDEGFEVLNIHGIVTEDPRQQNLIAKIPPKTIYEFACQHLHPEADTLFLSCTGLTMFDIIADLERDLGIPVVTSNQAAAWMIGRFFGQHGPNADRLGKLFSLSI